MNVEGAEEAVLIGADFENATHMNAVAMKCDEHDIHVKQIFFLLERRVHESNSEELRQELGTNDVKYNFQTDFTDLINKLFHSLTYSI